MLCKLKNKYKGLKRVEQRPAISQRILIIIFLLLILSSCKTLVTVIKSNDKGKDNALLKDFSYTYDVLIKRTKEKVGEAKIMFRALVRNKHIFYELNQKLNIKARENVIPKSLKIESESILTRGFKVVRFAGQIIEGEDKSIRSGYYSPPYYYIEEDYKRYKLKASSPLFSSVIEHYIISNNMLKSPGEYMNYTFLNLVSLNAQEERITFEGYEDNIFNEPDGKREIKEYITRNHGSNYESRYKIDKQNRVIEKTDFDKILVWKLKEGSLGVIKKGVREKYTLYQHQ